MILASKTLLRVEDVVGLIGGGTYVAIELLFFIAWIAAVYLALTYLTT